MFQIIEVTLASNDKSIEVTNDKNGQQKNQTNSEFKKNKFYGKQENNLQFDRGKHRFPSECNMRINTREFAMETNCWRGVYLSTKLDQVMNKKGRDGSGENYER